MISSKPPYTSIRVSISAAIITAVFFVFLFFYLGVNLREYIYEDSKEIAKEMSRSAAVQTERYFNSALWVAKSIASKAMLIRNLGGDRQEVRDVLVSELHDNKNFLGAWTLWEPNAFDGKDHLYAGKPLHNSMGTLGNGYFYYNDSIQMEIMGQRDYTGSYYVLAKEKRSESILEPYRWTYGNVKKSFYGTSISIPLIDEGEFLGAIGIDIDIDELQTELNKARPYKSGYLSLITSKGNIVSHPDSSFVTQNFFSLISTADSISYATFLQGKELTLETVSEFTGEKVFRFFYPISLGGSEPWSIMVELPISDTTARSNQLIVVALIILLVGLGLIIFLIFNILDRRRYERTILAAMAEIEERGKVAAENARNYKEIFNSTSEAIIVYDPERKVILDVNDIVLFLFGYGTKADVVGQRLRMLSHEQPPFKVDDNEVLMSKALSEEAQIFEWLAQKSNGETFWAEVSLRSATINGHRRILTVVRDISEKKKSAMELEQYRNHLEQLVKERTEELEAANEELTAINDELYDQKTKLQEAMVDLKNTQHQLVQSEKMASLGVLASGIAHEINNPLNFIQGGILGIENYFAKHFPDHKDNVEPLISAIREGIHRSVVVVNSLNHYTRKDNQTKTICDIHSIINNSLIMIQGQIKDTIALKCNYYDGPLNVLCNEAQLHQVFLNILLNSIQAIDQRGDINISTTATAKKVRVVINDSGKGISPDDLNRITDPFFTTKDPGQGIGLGLSIALSIIRDHKGKIDFESVEGEGTTATITLPLKS
ncbi:MAG: ATP-binding protein [Tenuifilaceae bacterium]|nr:ATP-binding protein [Tenuifilaceae bacterium]